MSRKQLVGITRQNVQAHGGREVMVVGQEVWEEWTGRTVEETAWRKQAKRQWMEMEQASVRREWNKDLERDKVYDRGWIKAGEMGEGEPWLLLATFGHTCYPYLFNKMICTKRVFLIRE